MASPCASSAHDNGDDCGGLLRRHAPRPPRQGLARRLLHQALIDARDRGLTVSSLQATKMGYPIYERLGYEPICTLEMWERRA